MVTDLKLVMNGVRAIFWATLLFTFVSAELPPTHAPQLFPWDKAEHFTAFYVLSYLGVLAYPRARLVIVALWLAFFGGTIELVQALPFIHRDCDVMDWVADVLGIAASLAPTLLTQWRGLIGSARA